MKRPAIIIAALAILAVGCDPGDDPAVAHSPPADEMRISPSLNEITVDEGTDYKCRQFARGLESDVVVAMDWEATPAFVATAAESPGYGATDLSRRVVGVSPGVAVVTCRIPNTLVEASAQVLVRPFLLQIAPGPTAVIQPGQSAQFGISMRTFAGRPVALGSRTILWEALTPGVVNVATSATSFATVTGALMGTTELRATVVDSRYPGYAFGTSSISIQVPPATCGIIPRAQDFVIYMQTDPGGFAATANMANQATLTIAPRPGGGTMITDPTGKVNVFGLTPTGANGCTIDMANAITLGGVPVNVTMTGTYLSVGELVRIYTVKNLAGVTLTTYRFVTANDAPAIRRAASRR